MTRKSDHRAPRPEARPVAGPETTQAARVRPDHANSHGRATPRDATTRRTGAQTQAQSGASMTYQLGFTSGPSS